MTLPLCDLSRRNRSHIAGKIPKADIDIKNGEERIHSICENAVDVFCGRKIYFQTG